MVTKEKDKEKNRKQKVVKEEQSAKIAREKFVAISVTENLASPHTIENRKTPALIFRFMRRLIFDICATKIRTTQANSARLFSISLLAFRSEPYRTPQFAWIPAKSMRERQKDFTQRDQALSRSTCYER